MENTMASFQRAVEQDGANGLECDLCLTKDAQLVLWHDWDPDEPTALLRAAGLEPVVRYCPCPPVEGAFRKALCDLTLAEVHTHFGYREKDGEQIYRRCIASFEEFLAWAGSQRDIAVLVFDIKVPATRLDLVPVMMNRINSLLTRYRPTATVIFECATVALLVAMKTYAPQHHYTLDIEPPPGIVLHPAAYSAVRPALAYGNRYATSARPRAVTLAPWTTHRRIVQHDLRLLTRLKRYAPAQPQPAIISFTIDAEEELRTLVRMGVAGIQTNRPDVLRQVAEDMGVPLA
jgi:glycerophosphoryl diester phosphodiesterase